MPCTVTPILLWASPVQFLLRRLGKPGHVPLVLWYGIEQSIHTSESRSQVISPLDAGPNFACQG